VPTTTEQGSQLTAFLKEPTKFSYSDLIRLAETFKETDIAKQVLRSALRELTQEGSEPKNHDLLQNLLSALSALEKNGNVRLVLEHFLFRIRQAADGT
jgi:DNA polymerase III gamma/tau subunit